MGPARLLGRRGPSGCGKCRQLAHVRHVPKAPAGGDQCSGAGLAHHRDGLIAELALERGVAYFSSRAEALSGLEVVLGTGEILNTGYGHFEGSGVTHLYKYGLGA